MDELMTTPFLRKERGFLLRTGTPGGVLYRINRQNKDGEYVIRLTSKGKLR